MFNKRRFTSQDLLAFPDEDGKRYEIIDGELYITEQPHWNHQGVCTQLGFLLKRWCKATKLGDVALAPGVIFAEDDDVAPDVIWISNARLATALQEDGKLHAAPELVVEVLSPGSTNETRDKETKRKLYSRQGVLEYWVISWQKKQVEVYRRNSATLSLELVGTLFEGDILQSPHLQGFQCNVTEIFDDLD